MQLLLRFLIFQFYLCYLLFESSNVMTVLRRERYFASSSALFEKLSLQFASRICRGNLPWPLAVRISHGFLPWEFAVSNCRGNLPQLFAVAICCENLLWVCLVYVSKPFFYVSKPFFFVNKYF